MPGTFIRLSDDSIMIAYDLIRSVTLSASDPELLVKSKRIAKALSEFEDEIKDRQSKLEVTEETSG